MSKNEFEMDFKKSVFLEVRSENGCEKWQFWVWYRIRIWRTGRHTRTKNSQEYLLGDQCFKLFVLRIIRCNAPFLVSSARLFRKKNNLDPVSFGKREDTGDEGG